MYCEAAGASLMGGFPPNCTTFFSLPHLSSWRFALPTLPARNSAINQLPDHYHMCFCFLCWHVLVSLTATKSLQGSRKQNKSTRQLTACTRSRTQIGQCTACMRVRWGAGKREDSICHDMSACSCLPHDWTNNCPRWSLTFALSPPVTTHSISQFSYI